MQSVHTLFYEEKQQKNGSPVSNRPFQCLIHHHFKIHLSSSPQLGTATTFEMMMHLQNSLELEDTARYAGLLLAPAEGFGFLTLWAQKRSYYALLANFRPFLVSSSNRGIF